LYIGPQVIDYRNSGSRRDYKCGANPNDLRPRET
jgi:hypothetical protein